MEGISQVFMKTGISYLLEEERNLEKKEQFIKKALEEINDKCNRLQIEKLHLQSMKLGLTRSVPQNLVEIEILPNANPDISLTNNNRELDLSVSSLKVNQNEGNISQTELDVSEVNSLNINQRELDLSVANSLNNIIAASDTFDVECEESEEERDDKYYCQ